MTDSYYAILDVSPDASVEEIKRAYREKVKQHHPDRSDDPDAHEKFRRIREAKETLTDADARQRYDRRRTYDGNNQDTTTNTDAEASEQPRDNTNNSQRQRRPQAGQHTRGSRTRSGRHTETRTRERERTSSRQRGVSDQSVYTRFRHVLHWLLTIHHRPREWIRRQSRSPATVRQMLTGLAIAPTILRLGTTLVLIQSVTQLALSIGLSPAATPLIGLGIVLGSLIASYVGYAVLTPLPFEQPRSRERFKPAGRLRVWPIITLQGCGFGLLGLAAAMTTARAGVLFTMLSGMYTVLLFFVCSVVFTVLLLVMNKALGDRFYAVRSLKTGVMAAPVGAALLLFTRYGDGLTLGNVVQSADPSLVSPTPWVPAIVVGPIYVGMVANYLLALVVLGCFCGSVILMGWYLTVVPWDDRYEHGYTVRPTVWNLLAVGPFVILGWMIIAGVEAVTLSEVALTRSALWSLVFVLPTILIGAYLVRRQLEPWRQQQE